MVAHAVGQNVVGILAVVLQVVGRLSRCSRANERDNGRSECKLFHFRSLTRGPYLCWPIGLHGYRDDRRGGNIIREHFCGESAGKKPPQRLRAPTVGRSTTLARLEAAKSLAVFAVQAPHLVQSVKTDD